jgi:hypothetical protein
MMTHAMGCKAGWQSGSAHRTCEITLTPWRSSHPHHSQLRHIRGACHVQHRHNVHSFQTPSMAFGVATIALRVGCSARLGVKFRTSSTRSEKNCWLNKDDYCDLRSHICWEGITAQQHRTAGRMGPFSSVHKEGYPDELMNLVSPKPT